MIIHRVAPSGRRKSDLAGFSVGEVHRRPLDRRLVSLDADQPVVVLLDFRDVRSATASYLKATWMALHISGQSHLREASHSLSGSLPVRDVFPVVANLSDEVRSEFDTLLRAERLVAVDATECSDVDIVRGRVIGELEPSAADALRALLAVPDASASDLHARTGRRVAATAWSNRLLELARLRLAFRRKEGRQMFYTAIAKELSYG